MSTSNSRAREKLAKMSEQERRRLAAQELREKQSSENDAVETRLEVWSQILLRIATDHATTDLAESAVAVCRQPPVVGKPTVAEHASSIEKVAATSSAIHGRDTRTQFEAECNGILQKKNAPDKPQTADATPSESTSTCIEPSAVEIDEFFDLEALLEPQTVVDDQFDLSELF